MSRFSHWRDTIDGPEQLSPQCANTRVDANILGQIFEGDAAGRSLANGEPQWYDRQDQDAQAGAAVSLGCFFVMALISALTVALCVALTPVLDAMYRTGTIH